MRRCPVTLSTEDTVSSDGVWLCSGDDYTSPHSDQYFSGVDMTIGASFGDERNLVFEHKESKQQFSFPQHNGDIFAFTATVNNQFTG